MDKDNSISYSDFIKDPLDPKLFNTELVVKDDDDDGIIVLKCTNKLKANSELFISFGKESWIQEFRSYNWSVSNHDNNLMIRKAMSAYGITKSEIINAIVDYQTSQIIQNYILSHLFWENQTNHAYVNILAWKDNSCYINSVLQCLARIPALTQILLDTNLFHNMNDTTFLYRYITLLKLMTERKESWKTMETCVNHILDNR